LENEGGEGATVRLTRNQKYREEKERKEGTRYYRVREHVEFSRDLNN
jgi:hypothetical protein